GGLGQRFGLRRRGLGRCEDDLAALRAGDVGEELGRRDFEGMTAGALHRRLAVVHGAFLGIGESTASRGRRQTLSTDPPAPKAHSGGPYAIRPALGPRAPDSDAPFLISIGPRAAVTTPNPQIPPAEARIEHDPGGGHAKKPGRALLEVLRDERRHLEHADLLLAAEDDLEDVVRVDHALVLLVLQAVLLDVDPELL